MRNRRGQRPWRPAGLGVPRRDLTGGRDVFALLNRRKEAFIQADLFYLNFLDMNTEFQILHQTTQRLTINQVDGRGTVSRSFFARFRCECASCDDEALVGPTLHRSSKVSDDL